MKTRIIYKVEVEISYDVIRPNVEVATEEIKRAYIVALPLQSASLKTAVLKVLTQLDDEIFRFRMNPLNDYWEYEKCYDGFHSLEADFLKNGDMLEVLTMSSDIFQAEISHDYEISSKIGGFITAEEMSDAMYELAICTL